MDTITINGLDRSQLEQLFTKLETDHATKITRTGDSALIEGHGVTASAVYDGAANKLDVSVRHHPFYIPFSAIENGLLNAVDSVEHPAPGAGDVKPPQSQP